MRRLLVPAFFMLAALACFSHSRPNIILSQPGDLSVGNESLLSRWPIDFNSPGPVTAKILLNLKTSPLSPTHYRLWVDDCVNSLTVNGKVPKRIELPWCAWDRPISLDLSGLLTPPSTKIELEYFNRGGRGRLYLEPSPFDQWTIFSVILFLVGCLLGLRTASTEHKRILLFGAFSVVLAFFYFEGSTYFTRSYDADAHLEYVNYIRNTGALPAHGHSFESHQPPLYYLLAAGVSELYPNVPVTSVAQAFSFLACLVLAGILLKFSLSHEISGGYWLNSIAFLALPLLSPALVMFGARITNDSLAYLLCSFSALLLIQWWKDPRQKLWTIFSALLALALLTKLSAIPLLSVATLLLLTHPRLGWREKLKSCLTLAVWVLLIFGWFFVLRVFQEGQTAIIVSASNLHFGLQVPSDFLHLVTFNPLQVILKPFNDPWSNAARRDFFLEYLFRSAFFGEFALHSSLLPYGRAVICFGGTLLGLGLFGAIKSALAKDLNIVPPLLILGAGFASLLSLRLNYPYACHQDFRFVPYLAIPVALFAARGAALLGGKYRFLVGIIVFGFVFSSALLLLQLA